MRVPARLMLLDGSAVLEYLPADAAVQVVDVLPGAAGNV